MNSQLLLEKYNFDVPDHLIAQTLLEPRGSSRLLSVDERGDLSDMRFLDITALLKAGDLLVFNDTKVIPALLSCVKNKENFQIEVNLLKEITSNTWQIIVSEDTWEYVDKDPLKELYIGDVLHFSEGLTGHVIDKNREEKYLTVQFNHSDSTLFEIFQKIGRTPLPPYIFRENGPLESDDKNYQTVFSKSYGSVAAPTAGLHFTQSVLDELKNKGVETAFVTLHVGPGTFFPVLSEYIEDHKMHSEAFCIDQVACDLINKAKQERRRVIAVGTTATRVLESNADSNGYVKPNRGQTDIFIREGYEFKLIDGLITNFHTPKSTLFMLVCALMGYDTMKKAYTHAIQMGYRFYSYGDVCFLQRRK